MAALGLSCGMWDLVPWPGIEPGPPASVVWCLSHWTTKEIPELLEYVHLCLSSHLETFLANILCHCPCLFLLGSNYTVCVCMGVTLVMANSLQPHGLEPARPLCPWDFPSENTGVGCHSLLQGIFPTQGLNPGFPHCRQTPYHLSHQGSPLIMLTEYISVPLRPCSLFPIFLFSVLHVHWFL